MKPTRYGRGKDRLMESSSGATAGSPSIETNRHQAVKANKGNSAVQQRDNTRRNGNKRAARSER